ncbi:unnamed protein product [Coccothraustes coccothraustes]
MQCPQQAGDGLDEATWERMQQWADYLSQEMARLMLELEHKSLEQSTGTWGALLPWQFGALVAILLLLPVLCFGAQKFRHHPGNGGPKESYSKKEEEEEDNLVAEDALECKDANVETYNKDGKEEGHVGNKAKQGSNDAKEDLNSEEKEVSAAGNGEDKQDATEEDEHDVKSNLEGISAERIQFPVVELDKGCLVICDLMAKMTDVLGQGLSHSFYPVPQEAIGVGSAFEGWSSCADVAYQVLNP